MFAISVSRLGAHTSRIRDIVQAEMSVVLGGGRKRREGGRGLGVGLTLRSVCSLFGTLCARLPTCIQAPNYLRGDHELFFLLHIQPPERLMHDGQQRASFSVRYHAFKITLIILDRRKLARNP